MFVIVSYDVATRTPVGRRRLRRVAKICEDHGQRVQNSVFECLVDHTQWTELRAKLLDAYEPAEDSLRFYFLGKNWRGRKEHHGIKPSFDPEAPMIV